MIRTFTVWAQSVVGRILAVAAGLGVVSLLVYKAGPGDVWSAVTHTPALFLWVLVLEVLLAGSESWAAILIYGPKRHRIPFRETLRTSLLCYSLIGVLPFGRAAGEAARAAMLSKYVGGPLAAASAARMQALSLLGNAVISIPCIVAVIWVAGARSWLFVGIVGHFAVVLILGFGLLLAGRHTQLGDKIGRLFRQEADWGAEVDAHFASNENLMRPLMWISVSRVFRVVQRAVLLAAVGATVGVVPSFVSESVNLVANAVGDLIPSQVGITEAGYAFASQHLGVTQSDGIAMALLVHIAQLLCIGVGFLSPVLAPPMVSEAR